VLFPQPGRYGWLLQYYLRAAGNNLSWVGTGRCLASLDFEAEHYTALEERILAAARRMREDGWLSGPQEQEAPARQLRVQLARELATSLLQGPLAGAAASARAFYEEVMRRKADDHHASHHNTVNQALHFASSSAFVVCYWMAFSNLQWAMLLGLPALFARQIGHAIFEPPAREKEETLLGFTTPAKTLILASYGVVPFAHGFAASAQGWAAVAEVAPGIAWHWFLLTLAVVFGRVAVLCWTHGLWSSSVWFVKLLTDPFSDLVTYAPHRLGRV
jgi:glutamate-1-semialdehyde 2,1-aminomutase